MTRASFADRVLQLAVASPSFRLLPAVMRLIFYEVLAFGNGAAERGRIRFLDSVSASVSRLLSISETDAETGLQTLAKLGLLEIDAETNSLWLPGARANSARADAARINGLRGGRPSKAKADQIAQGSLMLPIRGGRPETQETEAKPNAQSSRAATTSLSQARSSSTAREETAWDAVAAEVVAIAGMMAPRGGFNLRPVQVWMAGGKSRAQILAAVRDVASRPTYDAASVRSLNFFRTAVEQQQHQAAGEDSTSDRLDADAYSQAAQAWAANPAGRVRPRREDFVGRRAA